MVSTIKKRGDIYYCSNCQMRVLELRPNCFFCGNEFSNYESILIQQQKEKFEDEIKDESTLHREN